MKININDNKEEKARNSDKKTDEQADANVDDKDALLADYKEHLQRLQAEFDNYRKKADRDKEEICRFASYELCYKMLAVLDSFELALENKSGDDNFVKGIEMIYGQIYSLLKKEGLKKIEALNKKFDSNYHEVLLSEVRNDVDEDIVIEELQKGYMLNNKVLRYAKVKISKKPKENN